MSVIPAWFLAIVFFATSVFTFATTRYDHPWAAGSRVFLAAAMLAWSGFYFLVQFDTLSFDILRTLSRWLHLPTAVAVSLIVGARWYHGRKVGNGE